MGQALESPAAPPDWETTSPAEAGLDPAALSAAAEALGRSHSNARAFLVARGGRIACEHYFKGTTAADRLHLFSVTKSVISALVGIAMREGKIASLDLPVLSFFPEAAAPPSNPLGLLTLRHLLSMTTGMAWPGGHRGHEPMFNRLIRSPDWGRFILSLPVRRANIGRFNYNSGASHLLSLIITRATGQPACEYAASRLFGPLGIAPVRPGADWDADPQGCSTGGWGLHLSARELARFGLLYLRGGRAGGQEIIPADYLRESTSLPEGAASGYGYQFWLRRFHGLDLFAAQGLGGQYAFCVPARDLLIVILSHPSRRWPDRFALVEDLLGKVFVD